ncbi:MAG: polyribonucleotide nucleotidyltransferase [Bradymonadales bacterium]
MATYSFNIGERNFQLELGTWAAQTNASIVLRTGAAVILCTVVVGSENAAQDFFPLTVEYRERAAAGGKIPGSFARREMRASDEETLCARIIDRSIRPLFPKNFKRETVVTVMVFSGDRELDMPTAALSAVSLALLCSEVPWEGPVVGLRINRVGGEFLLFAPRREAEKADMDFVISVGSTGILMVEGGASEVSEDALLACLDYAQEYAKTLLESQRVFAKKHAKTKWVLPEEAVQDKALCDILLNMQSKIQEKLANGDKMKRNCDISSLKEETLCMLQNEAEALELNFNEKYWSDAFDDAVRDQARKMILDGQRFDKRRLNEIRALKAQVAVLPTAHGSAFFSRGLTQALATATLGGPRDALHVDALFDGVDRQFFLHYNFPPYSVGEARGQRSAGRREIGHGMLAQRALEAVIPSQDRFPQTIRVVSDILSSDGSSSMASVCAGCLALMDAGVPISAPVAGIAMGLISEQGREVVLSDIVGDEDHLGDMDFKVCGTKKGVTALQMDLKIDGLSKETMKVALMQAREARMHILDTMGRELGAARQSLPRNAAKAVRFKVRTSSIGDVIGPGGSNIRALMQQTESQIDIDDDGYVRIAALNEKNLEEAQRRIVQNTRTLKLNEIISAGIIKIQAPFMRVELLPGIEASLHFNDIAQGEGFVEDRYKAGDSIQVRILGCDERGNLRITHKI